MTTLHDKKSRHELFGKAVTQTNDNQSPTVSRDYTGNDVMLFELSNGDVRGFPHFCLAQIFMGMKGDVRILYSTGTIVIKGKGLDELVRMLASKTVNILRVTPKEDENQESFCIDSITYEEA